MKRKTVAYWERVLGQAVNEACRRLDCKHHRPNMPDHGLPFFLVPQKEEEKRKAK